jgi:3-hydroxymyristoyl/3-hydroxydecanoyl-(acyl carrier protein) dehydratase
MITEKNLLSFSCYRDRDERTSKIDASMVFDREFSGFDGHFPGNPVLPAAIQIAAIRFLCEKAAGIELVPVSARRIKFRAMVLPGETVAIEAGLTPVEQGYRVGFTISSGEDIVASGSMELVSQT